MLFFFCFFFTNTSATVTCKNPSSAGQRGKISLVAVYRGNGAPPGPTNSNSSSHAGHRAVEQFGPRNPQRPPCVARGHRPMKSAPQGRWLGGGGVITQPRDDIFIFTALRSIGFTTSCLFWADHFQNAADRCPPKVLVFFLLHETHSAAVSHPLLCRVKVERA